MIYVDRACNIKVFAEVIEPVSRLLLPSCHPPASPPHLHLRANMSAAATAGASCGLHRSEKEVLQHNHLLFTHLGLDCYQRNGIQL